MIRSAEPMAQFPAEAPEQNSSSNIYRIAWQRKSLIILALVIALVLGSLYYANSPPVYQSSCKLLVIRKTPTMIAADNSVTSFVEDYLTTHTQLLQSPYIIRRAVEAKDLKNLSMFAGMDQAAIEQSVANGLQVTRDTANNPNYGYSRGSSILALTFKGGESFECQKVLDAVIFAYKDYLDRTYSDKSTQVYEHLKNAENLLGNKIQVLQKEQLEFVAKNPLLDVRGTDVGVGRLQKRAHIENAINDTEIKARNLRIRIETIEKALREGNAQSAMLLLAMEYTRSYGDSMKQNVALDINNKIFNLEQEKLLLENEFGPKHPNYLALEKRIKNLKDYGASQKLDTKKLLDNPLAADEKDKQFNLDENPLVSSLGAQKLEVANMENALKYWRQEWDNLVLTSRQEAPLELQYRNYEQNLQDYREQLKAISSALRSYDLSKTTGGIEAQVIFPPGVGNKVEPKPVTVFALASMLGLIAGFGLAYLADVTDKSFRSPEEIRRRLNLPVLGHIPSLLSEEEERAKADGVAGPDPILVTYYKSKSRKAEVFRAVRTALYFNTRGEGHKVIQITSPNMGDGKTTLSTNLAVSIAQSGKRIILIDADFRRPRIHKIFGAGNDLGFTSVLTGQCELREAIQPSSVPGLSLLSSGPIPPNPAELLTSPRFKELIDELREQYDFVIIDTPPLLVVTDPCVVAPRVDGVLLCIRVAKNGRPVAERAREVLVSLGANVLGVVVNGISLFGQGYGYGYSYGYQYGQYDYGSQYQYKYDYYDRYYGPYDDYYNDRDEDGNVRKAAPALGAAATDQAPAAAAAPADAEGKPGWLNRMFGKK